jgi:protein-S-isoprenylcysteine O-methyltransferase Ste14
MSIAKLLLQALGTFLIGVVALGVFIFVPAGTLDYWQAWVFIVVFGLAVNGIGIWLSLKDPALLERRKKFGPAKESSSTQKVIASLILLSVAALLIVPALDHRFGWSHMPALISLAGDALVVIGLGITLLVLRENSYSGSTVEVREGQQVISTGLYGHVRHPMYTGALVMCIGVPLALGSWWGLVALAATFPVLIWRILDEEHLLVQDLQGYGDYMRQVRYRLVPHVW